MGFDFECPSSALEDLRNRTAAAIEPQMIRVNGLTLGNAILAGILVGIGVYGTRYRHRAFIRALFQGANTLFLPILSYVASNASTAVTSHPITNSESTAALISSYCDASVHLFLVLIWAGLVHIVGINTCTTVASSKREDRTTGLPMVLLVQAIWSTYLVVSLMPPGSYHPQYLFYESKQAVAAFSIKRRDDAPHSPLTLLFPFPTTILLPITFALIFAKMTVRFFEFQKARRSVALGRNPSLIVGYMKQLRGEVSNGGSGIQPPPPRVEHHCPPPLLVMGEDRDQVDKGAHGFTFKQQKSGLVTIDKVWQLDDMVLTSAPWLKEVCLSSTLFKLLRCRFAGYTVAEAGFQQVRSFFLHVFLKDEDHERVHGVITDELSFLNDYYYSSIPIHYSNFWLPIANISISLLTVISCLSLAAAGVGHFISEPVNFLVYCTLVCSNNQLTSAEIMTASFGNIVYDVVPVAILLALVVLAEAREIASYICSNWTKVALFSHCVVNNHDAWQRSPRMQRWIGRVLRCRFKKLMMMTHWDDKMYQCSVLVLHPRRVLPITSLVMRLLRLPDRKENVKVPEAIKAGIVSALTSNNGLLTDPKTFLRRSLQESGIGIGSNDDFLWACESEGISDLLLIWHIATSIILDMRQGHGQQQHPPPLSDDMIVATHLSQYCAYLVAYTPELLPDDDEWCTSLYKAVKKGATRVLHGGVASMPMAEARLKKLLALLQEPGTEHHVVLTKGVKLGEQLVQLQQREAPTAWRFLAGFWSRMILYIAPSDNLEGHAEAIARGGELITLVWALLMNLGIDSRPSSAEGAPATADGV